jgi:hypothetical protein
VRQVFRKSRSAIPPNEVIWVRGQTPTYFS